MAESTIKKEPITVNTINKLNVFSDSAHRWLIFRGEYTDGEYLQFVCLGDTGTLRINKSINGTETTLASFGEPKKVTCSGTTNANGLLQLTGIPSGYIPVYAYNFSYVTSFFNGSTTNKTSFVRITDYTGNARANTAVSMDVICVYAGS